MSNIFERLIRNRSDIFKYLLVLGTVFLISLLFPNNVRFKYEYQEGQIWRYGDLDAPFDFAIKKPAEDLAIELQNARSSSGYYYTIDPDKKNIASTDFETEFLEVTRDLDQIEYRDVFQRSDRYLTLGKVVLDTLYSRGLILNDSLYPGDGSSIKVVTENTVTERVPMTIEEALRYTTARLSESTLDHASLLYPVLERNINPNISYSEELTTKFLNATLNRVPRTRGMVTQGDLIIPKNGLVTPDVKLKLDSFRDAYEVQVTENKSYLFVFAGYLILTSLIIGVFIFYLQFNHQQVFSSFRKLMFMMMWLLFFSYFVYIIEGNETLSSYLIPFCIAPIVIKTFYNDRLALFTHIVIILIASFLSRLGYEFTFLQVLSGIVAILSNQIARYWSKFFNTIFLILITYCLGFLGLALIKEGNFSTIDWSTFRWFGINAVLTLLAYPMIPLLERVFGFTSSITLSELGDVNRPLLKELSIKAPGTFQHSLQVGNLAEAAADAIRADALLLKVAALYHDIGKVHNPTVFIENQGTINPHDNMSPRESAATIIAHVTLGVEMATKARLPSVIIDLIRTHHGTTRVEYFYKKFLEEEGSESLEDEFRYPGPKPTTKEQVILMLADSIEAASKSLHNPGVDDLNNLVDKIIAHKQKHGQLQYADISFKELEKVRHSLKKVLKSIHHIRVEYPEPAN